jgi:hypothetical protein
MKQKIALKDQNELRNQILINVTFNNIGGADKKK